MSRFTRGKDASSSSTEATSAKAHKKPAYRAYALTKNGKQQVLHGRRADIARFGAGWSRTTIAGHQLISIPENSGHRTIHLHSPCTDQEDLSNLILTDSAGDVVNSLRVEAKHAKSQRSGYDVSRGTTDEETFGPNPELPELRPKQTGKHCAINSPLNGMASPRKPHFDSGGATGDGVVARITTLAIGPKSCICCNTGANPNVPAIEWNDLEYTPCIGRQEVAHRSKSCRL